MKTERGILTNSNTELLTSATQKEAKSARMNDSIFTTIHSLYFRFAFNVEKGIVSCCRKGASELITFTPELQGSWRGHSKNVKELGVPRENGTLFALGYPFDSCSSRTQYTPYTSSAEQKLQGNVKPGAIEQRWTRLLPTWELMADIVLVLKSNKALKQRVSQALSV